MSPKAVVLTDLGKKRERNEDSFLCLPEVSLYAVADGMGGHVGGERASALAIEVIREQALKNPLDLGQAVRLASAKIHHEAIDNPHLQGMGTTATVLAIRDNKALVAHVGDSRLYRVRHKGLEQISEDHSLVQEQYKAGLIDSEQLRSSRFKNIITRCLGFEDELEVDTFTLDLEPGDIFLLCTDGLTTMLEDHEILEIILKSSQKTVAQDLIRLANSRGGFDNTTVLLVYV